MGIFSFFKRQHSDATDALPQPRNSAPRADDDGAREAALREIARATALKIDAIEAAMSFDIFDAPEPPWSRRPARRSASAAAVPTEPGVPERVPSALTAQVDAIALAYADGDRARVEAGLVGLLHDTPGAANTRAYWALLLDFYQLTGQEAQFNNLAIDYAAKFESFPPLWSASRFRASEGAPYAGRIPTLALPSSLDGAVAGACARVSALAPAHPLIRIELGAVTQCDHTGCLALVHLLRSLQQGQREIILVAAAEMIKLLRSQVRVGRREADAAWVLLLELLRLSQREKDYRETSVDYRVTYNMSPPPYHAPVRVALADAQNRQTPGSPDRFMMPPTVTAAGCATLHDSLRAYAAQTPIAVLDCSRLMRVERAAAEPLLRTLQSLATDGKAIELHDVNHLVAHLLATQAFTDVCKILHHRY